MAADFRKFDEHGFPLPPQYSDLKYHDEALPRPKLSPRAKRIVLLGIIAAVLALLFGPKLFSLVKELGAEWLSTRAEEKLDKNDFAGALRDLNLAVGWNPNAWECFELRGQVRMQMNDLHGSLADFSRMIDILETHQQHGDRAHLSLDRGELLARAYTQRSWVYLRLQRGSEAIADATAAYKSKPTAEYLNGRAYVRAMANTELADGLKDIDQALAQGGAEEPDYLDTRGYLLHLLEKNDEALKVLDRAIQLERQDINKRRQFDNPRDFERALRSQQQALAVMYHHRGLVYGKLNRPDDAAKDLKHGDALGYDPDHGVF